jgi:hypothetical protein
MLHAWTLGFEHPNGQRMAFSVDPPEDFLETAGFAGLDVVKVLKP